MPARAVHFIGVLTPAVASLAVFTARLGADVTASDDHDDSLLLAPLRLAGVSFFGQFGAANIGPRTELVVVSPYYDKRHVEVAAALEAKIPVVSATEYTREISQGHRRLIILDEYAGPLVASFLAHTLTQGYFGGNFLTQTVSNQEEIPPLASPGEGEWFVMPASGFKRDAATYEAAFLSLAAEVVIIPNLRYDYPELNSTLDDVYQSYFRFAKAVPRQGTIIAASDWSRVKRLRLHLADRKIETYGSDSDAAWRIREAVASKGQTTFELTHGSTTYGPLTIPTVGETMVAAATATFVAAMLLDLKPEIITRGLANLPPLKRYYSQGRDRSGRLVIDDGADHPETIRAVLETVRGLEPIQKIWCLYQPGSFLRTKSLREALKEALALADIVYLADIKGYPREKSEGLNTRQIIAEFRSNRPQTYYLDPSTNMTALLNDRVGLQDAIVTLGVEGVCQAVVQPLLRP